MPVELSIIVPDEVAAEVALRLQQRYPDVVAEATTPADAMRRVVGWWTANLLADSVGNDILQAAESQASAIRKKAAEDALAARQGAWDRIREVLATQPDAEPPPAA